MNAMRWMTPMDRLMRPLSALALAALLPLVAAEAGDDAAVPVAPDPTTLSPEQQRLEAWSHEKELLKAGREAAAQFHYDQGKRALAAGRMPEAIRQLTIAVDYFPANEEFQRALDEAKTIAGLSRDPRSTHINDIADQLTVQQQELWIEVKRKIEEGERHLEKGEYNQAELSFELARVRLESLPYADERREAEMRRVEVLLGETTQRRAEQDLQEHAQAVESAQNRERTLREESLKLERDRIEAMLGRALKARERRDFDEAILLCEQVLRINRAETRAHDLLVRSRRERHLYLRQITADKWDEEHKLLSEQIREAMLPQLDIVTYAEDWDEIDARRSAPVRGLEQESMAWKGEVERKLEQTLTLDFPELEIQDVVNFLQRNTDVNFVLDPEVVAGGGVAPITMQLSNVKLRNALEFIMLQTNLRYTLQDEAIYISDVDGLRGDSYMKVYDIRDLTIGLTQFPGPELEIPEPGGTGANLIPEIADDEPPDVAEFQEIIEEVVSPDSWDVDGVGIEEWNGSLVVTQTGDVHRQIEELLRTLRNQQAVQINVKVRFLSVENGLLEEIGVDWNNFRGPPGWPGPNLAGDSLHEDALGSPGPYLAGANPATPGVTPPWWLGGYWRDNDGENVAGGQVTNNLLDYFSGSGLTNTGGLDGEFQLFEDPEGFLGRAVLKAVEKTRRGNIVISPDLTLMSGQRAHVVRMNQQAYVADYDLVGDQYDPIVTILSYGTVLDVEAIASADRKWITMTLRPTTTEVQAWRRFGGALDNFGGIAVINTDAQGNQLGAIADQYPIMIPQLTYRSVRTSVTIPDGGSLMIAGMTRGLSKRSHSGVPVLSHIPFLGRLFSKNGRTEREYKDLIYVTGNIIIFDEIEERL